MNSPVIIIGAGFGGLCTALELAKYKSHLDREIILIDRASTFVYTPLLYEVATGYDPEEADQVSERAVEEELMIGVAISFDDMKQYLTRKGIRLERGDVTSVDWETNEIIVSGEQRIAWSFLVFALGSETDFNGIAGLQENSYQLKNIRQALAIRRALRRAILEKARGERTHVSVVVGGAGATGVEFMAELVKFFEKAIGRKMISRDEVTLTIIEATKKVLPMFHPKFSAWAKIRFDAWGVKTYLDTCIKTVEPGKVTLTPRPLRDGETTESLICEFRSLKEKIIDADVVVWTGGVRASSALAAWGLPCDRKGRVEVNQFGEVKERPHLFAIGDCAALIDPKTNQPIPGLAQSAKFEGHVVAHNIVATVIKGSRTAYDFPYMHAVIPLGAKYALADVSGHLFHGFLGWIIRQLADLRYYLHILPVSWALRIWFRELKVFGRND